MSNTPSEMSNGDMSNRARCGESTTYSSHTCIQQKPAMRAFDLTCGNHLGQIPDMTIASAKDYFPIPQISHPHSTCLNPLILHVKSSEGVPAATCWALLAAKLDETLEQQGPGNKAGRHKAAGEPWNLLSALAFAPFEPSRTGSPTPDLQNTIVTAQVTRGLVRDHDHSLAQHTRPCNPCFPSASRRKNH